MKIQSYKEKWEALKNRIGGESGDRIVAALKDLYTLYGDEIVDWYAGLYDAKIGGYYYSNSARDNEYRTDEETLKYHGKPTKLLPDVESTFQAINFWCSGLDNGIKEWGKWLPEWQQKQIVEFTYNLQDEDGFFYHPQWGKNVELSRRGRDYMWSKHILEHLNGGKFKYPTFEELERNKSAKQEEGAKEESKTLVPDHLSSVEKFREYLDGLKITERSYHSGNELAAQVDQIRAFGLLDYCCDYLTEKQNEMGHWHHTTNYYSNDGVFKICFLYDAAKRPIPRPLEAAKGAIKAIASDEPIGCVCDLYNTWYVIRLIVDNVRKFGGENADQIADGIRKEIWAIADEGIRKSKEKIADFKKPDGAFSYGKKSSAWNSQGAPVAIPDTPEGDVNATNVTMSMVGNIYISLGLENYAVPLFAPELRERYIRLLEEKRDAVI